MFLQRIPSIRFEKMKSSSQVDVTSHIKRCTEYMYEGIKMPSSVLQTIQSTDWTT